MNQHHGSFLEAITAPRQLPRIGKLDEAARHAMLLPMVLAISLVSIAVLFGPWKLPDRNLLLICFLLGVGFIVLEWIVPWDRVPAWIYLAVPIAGVVDLGIAVAISGGWQSPFLTTIALPVVFAGLATNWRLALPVAVLGGIASASPAFYTGHGAVWLAIVGRVPTYVVLTIMVGQLMDYVRFGDRSALAEQEARSQTERQAEDLVTLQSMSSIVASHLSLDDAIAAIVRELGRAFGHERIAVYLLEGDGLTLEAQVGYRQPSRIVALGEGIGGQAAASGETIIVQPQEHEQGSMHGMAIPVRENEDVVGVLVIESAQTFSRHDQEVLELFASQVSVVFHNARLAGELRHLARHDQLTQLLNHGALLAEMDRAIERGRCGVLMIDLNSFKVFNDTYGHLAGDEVLRQVARGLLENSREVDVAGRFGGDEFVMVLPGANRSQAEMVVRRLGALIRQQPYHAPDGTLVPIGVSIGAAAAPEDGTSRIELLGAADRRMYEQKPARSRDLLA